MIFNILLGSIILGITIWVHKHTYRGIRRNGELIPLLFPMWLLISMIIVAFIPILNIIVFSIGLIFWFAYYFTNDIRLENTPKWFNSIRNFLTRQV